ncbi:MAG: TVP38/TMEM64 family protein [Proteobacteria bacterium]|nr:TVP38/TMEM64 family protein [Pseudomonadota bacterium]MBU1715714.1 TVP38/TMEM64 family protein [Pseudomonadota bacterium]
MDRLLKHKLFWLILLLLAISGVLLYLFRSGNLLAQTILHLQESLKQGELIREHILAYGPLAPIIFIVLQVLQVILAPIPGEASGILGGYIFGTWPGFLYSSLGLTIGSWLAFVASRLFGDIFLARFKNTRVFNSFNHLVCRGDFVIPFILFILPGFPKDSLSYLLGLSIMPLPVFIFITAVGRMPGTLILSLQGAEVFAGNYLRLLLLLFISISISVPCYLWRQKILRWLTRRNNKIIHSEKNKPAENDLCEREND